MDKLSIGKVILDLRKQKKITQEELGNIIGVSTAAVSKWESGISYPDITLLPNIAILFNVSIDKLLNFKIKLSKEEALKIVEECENLFSKGYIEKAVVLSKEYISKYPGSYFLKLRIGFLFTVYFWKEENEEKRTNMITYGIELYEDVSKNCNKIELVDHALYQLAGAYVEIGEEDKGIDVLNKIYKCELDPNTMLSSIYIKKNEIKKGREILETNLYKAINDININCSLLATSYKDAKDKNYKENLSMAEKYLKLSIDIQKVLSPNRCSVLGLSSEYLNFAQVYLKFNEKEKAIDMLLNMIDDIRKNDINNQAKLNCIWCFKDIKQDEKRMINMNLYENLFSIFKKSEFDSIRESKDFINIIDELKRLEKKSFNSK